MSCQHHPTAETLLNFASGQLESIHNLAIEAHLTFCEQCDKHVSQLQSIGGNTLESQSLSELTTISFDTLCEQLPEQSNETVEHKESQSLLSLFGQDNNHPVLKAIQCVLKGKIDSINWQWRTKRFAEVLLTDETQIESTSNNLEAKLLYIKAGMKIPQHTHKGSETTVILQGSFSDHMGQYYAGDYIVRNQNHNHSPYAQSDCVCFAITNAPLKFTGFFGPLINWMFN